MPQVETAAFGGRRLYAVRNYDAEWSRVDRETSFKTEGFWRTTQQGLEVYNLEGVRLAALELPDGGVSWMRADANGRIFLAARTGIIVARDPTRSDARCTEMPRRIQIPYSDVPP